MYKVRMSAPGLFARGRYPIVNGRIGLVPILLSPGAVCVSGHCQRATAIRGQSYYIFTLLRETTWRTVNTKEGYQLDSAKFFELS